MEREDVAVLLLIYLSRQPLSDENRQRALAHLIELALYEQGGKVFESELPDILASVTGLQLPMAASTIQPALDHDIESGRVVRIDGQLELVKERQTSIAKAHEQFRADEKHFQWHVNHSIGDVLGRLPAELAQPMIVQAVATIVVESARRCERGEASLAVESGERVASVFDPVEELASRLRVVADNFEPGNLEGLILGVRRFFGELDEPCQRYIEGLYQKVFCHQILNLDPKLHEVERQSLSSTHIYLDTNVAVDLLLGRDDSLSRASRDVIEACRALKVQLFVSPATLRELEQLRDSGGRQVQLIKDSRLRAIVAARPGIRTNPFVLAFLEKAAANSSLTWAGFIGPFRDLESLLLQDDVLVEESGADKLTEDTNYSRVWSTLRGIKPPYHRDEIVDHDAFNFLLIHRRRKAVPGNVMLGPGVWLMTRDFLLGELDKALAGTFDPPHSKAVNTWGEVFLPLQSLLTFVAHDYIAHLMRAQLGILPESEGVDLEFVSLLYQAEFDVGKILALEPEHAAQLLIDFQSDNESVNLARAAATTKDPEGRRDAIRRLDDRALALLADERDKAKAEAEDFRSRLQAAESALRAAEDEVRAVRLEIGQIQRKIQEDSEGSVLKRVWRALTKRRT